MSVTAECCFPVCHISSGQLYKLVTEWQTHLKVINGSNLAAFELAAIVLSFLLSAADILFPSFIFFYSNIII